MQISVILSTYNSPHLLEKAIYGYSIQDYETFDLIIADDGSTPDTKSLIDSLRQELRLEMRHVWHQDRGFRKCTILNKAIRETDSEYLVFSDGDCIPRKDFLSTHASLSERGYFLSGGYLKLPRTVSDVITKQDILANRVTDLRYLRSKGLRLTLKCLRLHTAGPFHRMLDALTTTKATWNGHNSSGWRGDVVQVNGFDERMRYGGQDRELGQRLINLGIRGKQIRHRAICVHLWHERGYVNEEDIAANRQIRRETARQHSRFTPYGIVKTDHPESDSLT